MNVPPVGNVPPLETPPPANVPPENVPPAGVAPVPPVRTTTGGRWVRLAARQRVVAIHVERTLFPPHAAATKISNQPYRSFAATDGGYDPNSAYSQDIMGRYTWKMRLPLLPPCCVPPPGM